VCRYLGTRTNNEAEYEALILGLETARKLGMRRLRISLDSELVVKQLQGSYKVKSPTLRPLYDMVRSHLKHFSDYDIVHIRRELNTEADRLANQAIDSEPQPKNGKAEISMFRSGG